MGFPTLLEATEFNTIAEDCFNDTYIKNTTMVASYQSNTIKEVFTKRTIKTLKALRKQLAVSVCDSNPVYVLASLIESTKKPDIIKQIVSLTLKIGKPGPHAEDLSEVFSVIREPTIKLDTLDMSDSEAVKRVLIEMSTKINDLESKQYQVNCVTCRDPDRPTQNQPEESLDQTNEVETEEEISASLQEAELPPQREVEPDHLIKVEPKTTLVFIANVEKSTTHEKLQNYSIKEKKVKVELDDIQDVAFRGQGRAFSVRVPVEKLKQFTANWPEGVKVEKFVSKQKNPAPNPPREYEVNRQYTRDRKFNQPPQNNYRSNPRNLERNNQTGDRAQKFRPTTQNDYNHQNRGLWRRDTPYQWRRETPNQSEENVRRR